MKENGYSTSVPSIGLGRAQLPGTPSFLRIALELWLLKVHLWTLPLEGPPDFQLMLCFQMTIVFQTFMTQDFSRHFHLLLFQVYILMLTLVMQVLQVNIFVYLYSFIAMPHSQFWMPESRPSVYNSQIFTTRSPVVASGLSSHTGFSELIASSHFLDLPVFSCLVFTILRDFVCQCHHHCFCPFGRHNYGSTLSMQFAFFWNLAGQLVSIILLYFWQAFNFKIIRALLNSLILILTCPKRPLETQWLVHFLKIICHVLWQSLFWILYRSQIPPSSKLSWIPMIIRWYNTYGMVIFVLILFCLWGSGLL